ncbi:unnamed protein product [Rotaria sp. Silwood1]|nr:unnamed protein product [Rotaria sp. Silwood1]CAF1668884.1 unnamed protein product [Rotaria sp. Silwood1]CAF3830506.1 unnamed protein product [Rotaria sp. Silwood1]CAF4916084.1 unnamed protein product [Rotaria sp. Silwood1]CAF4920196.1 unnamed protein product [Rotaria sp. Silwood1]
MYEDQMWLEECMDNDPWENVEIEPMFQYPVMENDFLSNEISQTPPEKDIAAALVLLKVRHRISTKGINDLCKLLKLLKMPNAPRSFYRIKRLLLPNPSASTSAFVTYICPVCCEATTSLHHCSNKHCTEHKRFHAPPLYYLRMPILQQLREILDHAPPLNFEQQQEKLTSDIDEQPRLRTNETYDTFMKVYAQERLLNHVELRDRLRGHISPCVLRELTYFDVGTSFLSDSLHNVYHGVMKRLLRLWFNKKYRKQPWSICSKLNVVDRYLSSINYPSTTVRIPRSLSKYEQYKANELRSILLFGFPALCFVLPLRYARHFLLLVVGMHIAESRCIHRTQLEDIRVLFHRFLKLFPILYTPRFNSQSVHSLHHIAASVTEYSSLSNYSTFNFESVLGLITSTVHSTRRPACEI